MAEIHIVMPDVFFGSPLPLQTNAGGESQTRLQLPHSTFIPVLVYELLHHSKLCSQCN